MSENTKITDVFPKLKLSEKLEKELENVLVEKAHYYKKDRIIKAIEDLNMTWPQLLDTRQKVMELYGVNGIPHIILFAPDGTIVARNLRGDEMKQKVAEIMKDK